MSGGRSGSTGLRHATVDHFAGSNLLRARLPRHDARRSADDPRLADVPTLPALRHWCGSVHGLIRQQRDGHGRSGRPLRRHGPAVESQAADGVLHVHLSMFIQMAIQFCSLHELAEFLREEMLTAEALKRFVSHVRCAAHPDVTAHERPRAQVEKARHAYADDSVSLVRRSSSGIRRRFRLKSGCNNITPDGNMRSRG